MPYPKKSEKQKDFINRFMSSTEAITDYPDASQRRAIAQSIWNKRHKKHQFKVRRK